ncbi:putative ribonuclease H-like domain-containing protein [Tanacetum coccineum]
MYSFNLENIAPSKGLACLIAKATIDESNKWHRRLGHVNFKNLNKLVKGNLVRGLPSKIFHNDHTCVACKREGIDLILWGHLRTLFETNEDDELWKNQEDWILKSWTFYENCGVHILLLEDDTEIPMLAEKRYPLAKETLKRMLVLGLTVESVSDVALDLIRIVMKQIEEM